MELKQKRMADGQRRQRRAEIADWIETYHDLTRKETDGGETEEPG
jgi:hypothetical protein